MTVTSDKAWEALGKIDRLDVWFPSIATCRVEGDGVGAHRYMTLHRGGDITDRIVDINPARRRLTYQRTRSPFPVTSYTGTVVRPWPKRSGKVQAQVLMGWKRTCMAERETCPMREDVAVS
jgi:hypothetical protein